MWVIFLPPSVVPSEESRRTSGVGGGVDVQVNSIWVVIINHLAAFFDSALYHMQGEHFTTSLGLFATPATHCVYGRHIQRIQRTM